MYIDEPPEQFEIYEHLKNLIGEWEMEVSFKSKKWNIQNIDNKFVRSNLNQNYWERKDKAIIKL